MVDDFSLRDAILHDRDETVEGQSLRALLLRDGDLSIDPDNDGPLPAFLLRDASIHDRDFTIESDGGELTLPVQPLAAYDWADESSVDEFGTPPTPECFSFGTDHTSLEYQEWRAALDPTEPNLPTYDRTVNELRVLNVHHEYDGSGDFYTGSWFTDDNTDGTPVSVSRITLAGGGLELFRVCKFDAMTTGCTVLIVGMPNIYVYTYKDGSDFKLCIVLGSGATDDDGDSYYQLRTDTIVDDDTHVLSFRVSTPADSGLYVDGVLAPFTSWQGDSTLTPTAGVPSWWSGFASPILSTEALLESHFGGFTVDDTRCPFVYAAGGIRDFGAFGGYLGIEDPVVTPDGWIGIAGAWPLLSAEERAGVVAYYLARYVPQVSDVTDP